MNTKRASGSWRFFTSLLLAILFFVVKKTGVLDVNGFLLLLLWLFLVVALNVFVLTQKEVDQLAVAMRRSNEKPLNFGMLSFVLPPGFFWGRVETGQQIAIEAMQARYRTKFFINFNMSRQTPDDQITIAGMKRLAESFVVNEVGGKLIRNEISEIAGRQAVDFEYTQHGPLHIRKIIFFYHLNEYRITFGEKVPGAFKKLNPLIDAFLNRLAIVIPPFKTENVLADRVQIGMPTDQWKKTRDDTDQVVWEKHPNADTHAKVRLSYINKTSNGTLKADLFKGVEDSLFDKGVDNTISWTPLDLPMSILFAQAPDDERQIYQYSFGIQLTSGQLLLLDYFYEGDKWEHGMISNMYFVTFALEIVATLSDIHK